MAEPTSTVRAVIFDWGGVVTNPIIDTVSAWLEAERIDRDCYAAVMRPWIQRAYGAQAAESPIHGLERGEVPDAEFEATLAAALVDLDGAPVAAQGLLKRMFAAAALQAEMLDLIRELRSGGMRTGLLSNSWGVGDYPRHLFGELFDEVVISAEVGMRKPEERIFQLTVDRLGLTPAQCVFVDDVEGNIVAAQALGFAAIHHREPASTRARLSGMLGSNPAGS